MNREKDIQVLENLYQNRYGCRPDSITKLSAQGGDRKYYRMTSAAGTCLGTAGDSLKDCKAFVALDRAFHARGINVPEVYAVSQDRMHYLQQDLGDVALFSLLDTDEWRIEAELTIETLVKLHTVPEKAWENAVGYKPFSKRQVMWDLNYFKYEYLKPLRIPFDEERLEDDFTHLAEWLIDNAGPQGFMMRDCQSRNVMIHDGIPWLIDFQGGRLGPVVYDLVSLLWQAKARLNAAVRQELVDLYSALYAEKTGIGAELIQAAVPGMVLFRTLQVLGAYGFRGIVEHKAHFIESIPAALANLAYILDSEILQTLPELQRVCRYAVEQSPVPEKHDGLIVKVFSFSYKRGYPEDMTGNGGGFMFDCRGMHNPGRYDEYKPLTGLDLPVRQFLEEQGEIQSFVEHAVEIVSPAVACYLRRGFSNLQVGFGCTGGRHRSVYSADAFGHKIKELYPDANVEIIHREQDIRLTL